MGCDVTRWGASPGVCTRVPAVQTHLVVVLRSQPSGCAMLAAQWCTLRHGDMAGRAGGQALTWPCLPPCCAALTTC